MTSAIDATKPIFGAPTTQSVRDNFLAAKNEIEALQAATTGEITGVAAGTGLTGGGTSGDVTLSLTSPVAVTNGGSGTATAFTAGSIVFAGVSSVYSQDNANLFWDDANNRLGIGMASPACALDVNGVMRATGSTVPTSGAGLEVYYVGGAGVLFAYDRTGAAFRPLSILASTTTISNGGANNGLVVDTVNNRVGIGTASPLYRLQVTGGTASTAAGNVLNATITSSDSTALILAFGQSGSATVASQAIWLQTQQSGGNSGLMALQPFGGNVGIGTASPGQKLDVNGTINGTAVTVAGVGVPTQSGPTAWTPTDISGAGLTLTVTIARYLRTGKLIVAWADITYPATANGSLAIIGGLPATPSSTYTNGAASGRVLNAGGTNDFHVNIYPVGPGLLITNSANVNLTNVGVSGLILRFQIIYSTD